MNYRDFTLGDWIGHISGVIEDETTLDGNEMRNLVEFLSTLKQEPFINKPCVSEKVCEHDKNVVLDKIRAEIDKARFVDKDTRICKNALASGLEVAIEIIDKYKADMREVKE